MRRFGEGAREVPSLQTVDRVGSSFLREKIRLSDPVGPAGFSLTLDLPLSLTRVLMAPELVGLEAKAAQSSDSAEMR